MSDKATGRRRWVVWALGASLALNLLLIGAFAGAALRGAPDRPALGLWYYGQALPDPYRRDLGRALRESRGDWIESQRALRDSRTMLAAALTAEPFEMQRVRAVLAQERRLAAELADRGARHLAEQIERMDAEERAAFAASLRERHRRRGERR